MLIIHFPETDKKIEMTRLDVAVHLHKGATIKRFKLVQGVPLIITKLDKAYKVEHINDRNHSKLMSLWREHKQTPAAIYLEEDGKAKLTNHAGIDVFCHVREV